MQKFSKTILAGVILCAATLVSCNKNAFTEKAGPVINNPAINVTNKTLEPNTDESGTTRAFVGTEVKAHGFNLDKVGKVTLDGVEAQIVSQKIDELVFAIPALSLAQKDEPQKVALIVYNSDKESVIFRYDYFVTIPVIDALVSSYSPNSGTVGTVVTISGRNLEQITKVSFGSVDVDAADFTSKSADAISMAVPAITVSASVEEVAISATWASGTINVTAAGMFRFEHPVFTAYTQSAAAKLGEEIVLAGEKLNLVDSLSWGSYEILISEQSEASLTIKIPSGVEAADPAEVTNALLAYYGAPAQSITVAEAFKVDTTPIGPAKPVFTSATAADEGYNGLYLGREVVVKGQNFASIESFKIDGTSVSLSTVATDIEARFVIPNTITGLTAKEVTLVAVWNGGNEESFGNVKVYPFYYTKGLKIRTGSNSKSTYPAANAADAFLLLDESKVVSSSYWKNTPVDQYALSTDTQLVTTGNKVTRGTEANYYSVAPYYFLTASSANKLAFQNPANSSSQFKNHRIDGTSLPSTFGTPLILGKIISDATIKIAVAAGTLETIWDGTTLCESSAPAFGKTEGDTWTKGSVIFIQYLTYAQATAGGKPTAAEQIRKCGYIYIKDVTCGDATTGLAKADRDGYVELDLYWSETIN